MFQVCESTAGIYLLLLPHGMYGYGLARVSIVDAVSGVLRREWSFPWSPPQLHSEHNVSMSVDQATGREH